MNKVFKVIWSEARNAYVVVSEIAKNHGSKSCSTKKLLTMLLATGVMTCASMAPAMAGNLVPDDKNIAIGSGASTNTYNYNNVYGDKPITGDIAIGQKAYAWNGGYNEGQDIYIGTHEYYMDFGQDGIVFDHYKWTGKPYYKVVDGSKVAGSIAIGKNSVARTGSTILGDHTYNGKIGDTEITSKTNYMNIQPAVFSTTIGSNTYNAGTLATVTGAFSIASSRFNGSGNTNTKEYGAQNTGATIYGSMNSIESATSKDYQYSGVASSVLGFANRTQNANAALVWGTGNEVTNSIEAVTGVDFTKWNSMSVSEAQKDAIKAMQSNKYAGGSVLAIGGGNKADYATYSQLMGVQNTLTGTASNIAQYTYMDGYKNTATNTKHTTLIGTQNKASNIESVTVMGDNNEIIGNGNHVIGDNHKVTGTNNVIFGSADSQTTIDKAGTVIIGHNANADVDGAVALGEGSVASRKIGQSGYGVGSNTGFIWQSTAGAVSIGDVSNQITRQIIGVAAGLADTDAVNVAQLKAMTFDLDAGTGITLKKTTTKDGKTTYTISTNIKGTNTDTDTTTVISGTAAGTTETTGKTDTSEIPGKKDAAVTGDTVTVSTTTKPTSFQADDGNKADIKPGETLKINGDGKNISTVVNGTDSIQIKLKDDIDVNKVTVGNTTITTDGVTIAGGPSMTKDGIDGGKQKVTGVAAGELSASSTDAVNGSQLYETNQNVANNTANISSLSHSISNLDNRVNKVGAGAAALAALHPLDFDPDAKWDFAAGYGNYRGTNAAAVGAYYRPNEDTMFSVGGTFGNGENMVNAGVSFKLGAGSSHVSTSRVAMAKEIKELRGELEAMKSAMLDANAGKKIDTSKLQLFPDVPQNHWAYEYVTQLAGNGMIEGYPDGNFAGDRPMTRYEFAAILYRAMTKGAVLSDKILSEFSHELEYFTVDTVAKDKAGNPTIQRVRTVKANTNK